jgi:hypothetical protein
VRIKLSSVFILLIISLFWCQKPQAQTHTNPTVKADISDTLIVGCWWHPHDASSWYKFNRDGTFVSSDDSVASATGNFQISIGTYILKGFGGWITFKNQVPRKFIFEKTTWNAVLLKVYDFRDSGRFSKLVKGDGGECDY